MLVLVVQGGGGVHMPFSAAELVMLVELVAMLPRSFVISLCWVVAAVGSRVRTTFLFLAAEERDLKWPPNCSMMAIAGPPWPVPVVALAREEGLKP